MLKDEIKRVRLLRGITQKELAERLGVYQKDVSRWESGERTPSIDMFRRICVALKVSADELLELNKEH